MFPFTPKERLPWQPDFVDIIDRSKSPGQNTLHDQGAYYCCDPSSVFSLAPLNEFHTPGAAPAVLDVCASPGGKSILTWIMTAPCVVICNEVIHGRIGALISNLKRLQIRPAHVLSEDASRLHARFERQMDIVLVDAPCSGQSMLRKGTPNPGCFHPKTITFNALRQRRILAESAQCLAPGGILVYMTCTYSREENEQNGEWFARKFPEFSPLESSLLATYRSHLSEIPCYRFWPWDGAGAFTCFWRRNEDGERESLAIEEIESRWKS